MEDFGPTRINFKAFFCDSVNRIKNQLVLQAVRCVFTRQIWSYILNESQHEMIDGAVRWRCQQNSYVLLRIFAPQNLLDNICYHGAFAGSRWSLYEINSRQITGAHVRRFHYGFQLHVIQFILKKCKKMIIC